KYVVTLANGTANGSSGGAQSDAACANPRGQQGQGGAGGAIGGGAAGEGGLRNRDPDADGAAAAAASPPDWNPEECDRFSFDDSDRFEEDSLCSWSSEPESVCNNWRGWKRPVTSSFVNTLSRKQSESESVATLTELAAKCVASYIPFELVEHVFPPVPEQLQLRIAFWSFPDNEEDIRLYSCLANSSSDEFHRGDQLFKNRAVKDPLQIGFHLSATIISLQPRAQYNVAVTFDRRRISSCNCTCASSAYWCSHVVAVCLHRIHCPNEVCLRAPVSESLTRLQRDQLQKFAQYLISELPQQILPTAQRLLDELLSSQPTAINTVCGAPDPTAGASANDQTNWYLDEKTLHDNIKRILIKFCLPAPIVFSDVNYLTNSAPPAAAEWSSLLRPLRGREPEGMWNLLSIVREMYRRCDRNAIRLLEIITEECMACDQILIWWFYTKLSLLVGSGGHSGGKHSNTHSNSNASQHACSSLCDEIVVLWRLAALNPGLAPDERDMLHAQFTAWHLKILDKVAKSRMLNSVSYNSKYNNNLRSDAELFVGFKPAIEACYLDWEDYPIPGVTHTQDTNPMYHCPFTCFKHTDSSKSEGNSGQLNATQAVMANNKHYNYISTDHHHQLKRYDRPFRDRCYVSSSHNSSNSSSDSVNVRLQSHSLAAVINRAADNHDDGNRSSASSEGFCENDDFGGDSSGNNIGAEGGRSIPPQLPSQHQLKHQHHQTHVGITLKSPSSESSDSQSSGGGEQLTSASADVDACIESFSNSSGSESISDSNGSCNCKLNDEENVSNNSTSVIGTTRCNNCNSLANNKQSVGIQSFSMRSTQANQEVHNLLENAGVRGVSSHDDSALLLSSNSIGQMEGQKSAKESDRTIFTNFSSTSSSCVVSAGNSKINYNVIDHQSSVSSGAPPTFSTSPSSSSSSTQDRDQSGLPGSTLTIPESRLKSSFVASDTKNALVEECVATRNVQSNSSTTENVKRRSSKDESFSSSGDEYNVYNINAKPIQPAEAIAGCSSSNLSPLFSTTNNNLNIQNNSTNNTASNIVDVFKNPAVASSAAIAGHSDTIATKSQVNNKQIFSNIRPTEDVWDILLARAEGLHAHGHGREACILAVRLAEEMLANPPNLMIELPPPPKQKGKKKNINSISHQLSVLASATLAKCAFLCTVLAENSEHYHLGFRICLFALEMPRPPASTKPLEVKLANQEADLLALLKRIPLNQPELKVIREKAELLRDGLLKSRGDALLPIMLASFIFDALVMPSVSGKETRNKVLSTCYRIPTDENLGFEAAVAALGLKANVSEAEHPLLCEGTRRQRGDLALTLLYYYKDEPRKIAKIMEKLLDRDIHVLLKSPLLPAYYSNSPPVRTAGSQARHEEKEQLIHVHHHHHHSNVDIYQPDFGANSRPHSSTSAELEVGMGNLNMSAQNNLPGSSNQSMGTSSTMTGTTTRSKDTRYKGKRAYPIIPNQPSEASAHFMFELAKNLLTKAGGTSSTSLFTQATTNQNHHGPHRGLHMCAFQLGLYALGLHNCVSPNWLSRTYSSHVSWIIGQAMEIGAPAISFLIDTWEGHLTPPEAAGMADRASRGWDNNMVYPAAELALSVLPHAAALNPNEIQRAILQCKEQSDQMLERACITVENAAKGGGVYPEVLFQVAKYWYELYMRNTPNSEHEHDVNDMHMDHSVSLNALIEPQDQAGVQPPQASQQVVVTAAPQYQPGVATIAPIGLAPYPPYSFCQGVYHHHNLSYPPNQMQMYISTPQPYQYPPPQAQPPPTAAPPPYVQPGSFQSMPHPQVPPQAYQPLPCASNAPPPQQYAGVQMPVQVNAPPPQSNMPYYPQPMSMQQPPPTSQQQQPTAPNMRSQPSHHAVIYPFVQQQTVRQRHPHQYSSIQLRYLLAAYNVGMLAMETLARRVHDDRPQAKYARNPPYGEDVKWLLRISKKLGTQYLHQFCVCAVNSIVSPFVLHDVAIESAHYLGRSNPQLVMQHLRSALAPLVQKCQQMYIQCIHQKLYHLTQSDYEEFASIILAARAAFQITPEGNAQFKDWIQSIKRSKSCKKDLWAQINAALQNNSK
ncbi:zinc finger SWIM domain-containing protein 8-like, partial [Hermetia illucens]|uniref:zinc finger SWIM domain-containing protein 8-like n=1 Tax=Hermetia illucens TaxID=343691 RepID=UPI0018CBF468